MSDLGPGDLAVIIPTRDRWPILRRTLDALAHQSLLGFETFVVVDGQDQEPPADLGASVRVLQQDKAGPGAARNTGVAATDRPLVLFLGDDIIPSPALVERHLAVHRLHAAPNVAVLGYTMWHPEVARGAHNQWLEWSASQFDYAAISGDDAGWGRFYSSNVSLKRSLFLDAGGFDEAFTFDYEDLDLAYRLHQHGLVLRFERAAVGSHLHSYDWAALTRRYHSRGQAERQMAAKHDWFDPYFAKRLRAALSAPPESVAWVALAARAPLVSAPLRTRVRGRADRWYHQQLAAPFFGAWHGQDDLRDLQAYLGEQFDPERLLTHRSAVDHEEEAAADEATFYRTSTAYLYDLTMFALWGTKEPYLAALKRLVPPGSRVLDYGCGIGCDGLRLLDAGYEVAFADFDNPSTRYLKWRLDQRGVAASVHDVDGEVPGGFDAVYCFDVIEHIEDPFGFLDGLERRGDLIMVNFLEPDPNDTHLHKPLPIHKLLNHVTRQDLAFYHRYEGRSHLVAYRPRRPGHHPSRIKSGAVRLRGAAQVMAERLTGLPPRSPT